MFTFLFPCRYTAIAVLTFIAHFPRSVESEGFSVIQKWMPPQYSHLAARHWL